MSEENNNIKIYQPEKDNGNVEYKRKILDNSTEKIEKLASQMRYRVEEGSGEAIFALGIDDDGTVLGVTDEEYELTVNVLKNSAQKNNYSINVITTVNLDDNKKVYELLVREINENKYIDIKVAVAGSVDSGKSTILGSLISGQNDNGRGSARLHVFNYSHEVKSGRTSSVAQHILGFNSNGEIVNYKERNYNSWPEIVKNSNKIVSFFDLAGHEKYLRTTISGLTSTQPDICFITVGANRGILKMSREHIFLCLTLKIPFVILLTKIDIVESCQNVLEEAITSINKILKAPGVRRLPLKVNTQEDTIICAKNIYGESIVPIFYVSSVTGQGLDMLRLFLNLLGKRTSNIHTNEVEFHIESTFQISGIGTVVGGQLISGVINVGDKLLIGPNSGRYEPVVIKSIHCKRIPIQTVSAGCYVCLGLKKIDRNSIRKGNVLLSLTSEQIATSTFTAEISVVQAHSCTIKVGYEPVLHSNNIRQSVRLISILNKRNNRNNKNKTDTTIDIQPDCILRTGDKATAVFEFCFQPEYLKRDSRIVLCEGLTRIVGSIV